MLKAIRIFRSPVTGRILWSHSLEVPEDGQGEFPTTLEQDLLELRGIEAEEIIISEALESKVKAIFAEVGIPVIE